MYCLSAVTTDAEAAGNLVRNASMREWFVGFHGKGGTQGVDTHLGEERPGPWSLLVQMCAAIARAEIAGKVMMIRAASSAHVAWK